MFIFALDVGALCNFIFQILLALDSSQIEITECALTTVHLAFFHISVHFTFHRLSLNILVKLLKKNNTKYRLY